MGLNAQMVARVELTCDGCGATHQYEAEQLHPLPEGWRMYDVDIVAEDGRTTQSRSRGIVVDSRDCLLTALLKQGSEVWGKP